MKKSFDPSEENSIVCLRQRNIFSTHYQRCRFLIREDGWYSCNMRGFSDIGDDYKGQSRKLGEKVFYDYDKLSHEKRSNNYWCSYKLRYLMYRVGDLLKTLKGVKDLLK